MEIKGESPVVLDWREAFGFFAQNFPANALVLVLATFIAMCIPSYIAAFSPQWLRVPLTYFLNAVLACGYLQVFLNVVDGERPHLAALFSKLGLYWKYLVVSIFCSLSAIIGMVFFIVPGLIFAARFSMAGLILVDKNCGPIEALKCSWAITNGQVLALLNWFFIAGLPILGAIVVLIALPMLVPIPFFATPVGKEVWSLFVTSFLLFLYVPIWVGKAYFYRKLQGSLGELPGIAPAA